MPAEYEPPIAAILVIQERSSGSKSSWSCGTSCLTPCDPLNCLGSRRLSRVATAPFASRDKPDAPAVAASSPASRHDSLLSSPQSPPVSAAARPAPDAPTSSSPSPNVSDAVAEAATQIDRLCALEEAELFLTTLWELLICIARLIPKDHPGQDQLVVVLESLQPRNRAIVNIWGVSILNILEYQTARSCLTCLFPEELVLMEGFPDLFILHTRSLDW
jgi:hypothetical protein